MTIEEQLKQASESRFWLWIFVLFLLLQSCSLEPRIRKLEGPTKPKPKSGFMVPTFPHTPHVRRGGDDQLALAFVGHQFT